MSISNRDLYLFVQRWAADACPGAVCVRLVVRLPDGGRLCLDVPRPSIDPEPAPAARDATDLTDCERDVIEVIGVAERRLTTEEVLRALQAAGKIHGDSTVVLALATLTQRKRLLDNRKDARGKGYALRE